jgi:CheY-like chemotaxis protein
MNSAKKIALGVSVSGLMFLSNFHSSAKAMLLLCEVSIGLVIILGRRNSAKVWDSMNVIVVVTLAHVEYTIAVLIAGYVLCQLQFKHKFDLHRIMLFAMVIYVFPPALYIYIISTSLQNSSPEFMIKGCGEGTAVTRSCTRTTVDYPPVFNISMQSKQIILNRDSSTLDISPINHKSCYSQNSAALHILQIGIIVYNHSSRVTSFSNNIGEQFIKQYNGLDNLLATLYNKRTHKSLSEDISQLYLNIEAPMSFSYYDCQFSSKSSQYQIRFAYIPESHSIALCITFECMKQFSTNQISSALKEITSCSLFHELINLVNGIYTNVELLEDDSVNRSDYYKGALMFLKVLTLRLRDIDDFTAITLNKFKMHFDKFNVYNLLIQCKEILNDFCRMKGINISLAISQEMRKEITSDQSRVLQVLVNSAYTLLEQVEFGTIFIEARQLSTTNIEIIINLSTNDKNKIEALLNSIKAYQLPISQVSSIKNIDGLPLISTFYISKKIGRGLEIIIPSKNTFEIHIPIKDGFYNESTDTFIKIDDTTPKSMECIERKTHITSPDKACSASIYYQPKAVTKSKFQVPIEPCKGSDACIVPVEREDSEIKEIHFTPIKSISNYTKIALHSCTYVRRSRRLSDTQYKAKPSMIISDPQDYSAIIVDDNYVNIMVLKSLLKILKVNVLCAKNGLECLNAVKLLVSKEQFFKIKIIFMDMQMPIMDGIEATKQIISFLESNKLKRPPIIGISSDNNEDDRRKFMAAGINEFFRKPISKNVVSDIYAKYVQF